MMPWELSHETHSMNSFQLRDRLTNIEPSGFAKKRDIVCVEPELSFVAEVSEPSSFRYRFGEGFYTQKEEHKKSRKKKHESDSEILKQKPREIQLGAVSDEPTTRNIRGHISETDDSIINDTSEIIPKIIHTSINNIVDLLVKEALGMDKTQVDSGVIPGDRKSHDSEIDNTPVQKVKNSAKKTRIIKKKSCAVISKSTTEEESNTEISETPLVELRKKVNPKHNFTTKINRDIKVTESKEAKLKVTNSTDNIDVVEDFFSSHYNENIVPIDPALAKKVNRSSSESSEDFNDHCLITNDPEIVTVKTPPYFSEHVKQIINECVTKEDTVKQNIGHEINLNSRKKTLTIKNEQVSKKGKGKPAAKKKPAAVTTTKMEKKTKTIVTKVPKRSKNTTTKNNPPIKPVKKMSIIIEDNGENIEVDSPCRHLEQYKSPDSGKSISKKKRKLYSSNDQMNSKKDNPNKSESEDSDIVLADLAPTTATTPYKEIEIQKRKSIRLPRPKRSRVSRVEEQKSPRTLKKDAIFDKVISTIDNDSKNIKVIDKDTARDNVYNFTSESEDEDFQKIKIKFQTRGNKTIASDSKSKIPVRQSNRRRRATSTSSNDEVNVKTRPVRKRTTKKLTNKTHLSPLRDIIDEKMREKAENVLNNSLIISKTEKSKEIDFVLKSPLRLEIIGDDEELAVPTKKKINKKINANLLNKKENVKNKTDTRDSETSSPLPGLIVETLKADIEDLTSVERLKQLCQENANAVDLSCHKCMDIIQGQNLQPSDENDATEIQPTKTKPKIKKIGKKIEEIRLSSNIDERVVVIPETIGSETDATNKTYGVTGHGDSNESPPDPRLLKRKIPPREMFDLNETSKRTLIKVNKDLYSPTDSNENSIGKFVETCNKKSPVVSLRKLSDSDINEWVSTRKSPYNDRSVKIDTNAPKTKKLISPTKMSDKKIETLDSIKSPQKSKSSKNPKSIWDDISEMIHYSVSRKNATKKPLSSPNREGMGQRKAKQNALTLINNIQEITNADTDEDTSEIKYNSKQTNYNSKFIGSKTKNDTERDSVVRKTRKSLMNPIPEIPIPNINMSMNNLSNVIEIVPKPTTKQSVDTIYLTNSDIDEDEATSAKSFPKRDPHLKITEQKSNDNSEKVKKPSEESRKRKNVSPIREMGTIMESGFSRGTTMESGFSRGTAKRKKNESEKGLSRGASAASVEDWVQGTESRSQDVDSQELLEDLFKNLQEKLETIVHEVDEENTQEMKNSIIKFHDELATDRKERLAMLAKMLRSVEEQEQKSARLQKEFIEKMLPLVIRDCKKNRARVQELLQVILEVFNHVKHQLAKK